MGNWIFAESRVAPRDGSLHLTPASITQNDNFKDLKPRFAFESKESKASDHSDLSTLRLSINENENCHYTGQQLVWRRRSKSFVAAFWIFGLIMTNFIYFYYTLHDFSIQIWVWHLTIAVLILGLFFAYAMSYIYDCLASAVAYEDGRTVTRFDV